MFLSVKTSDIEHTRKTIRDYNRSIKYKSCNDKISLTVCPISPSPDQSAIMPRHITSAHEINLTTDIFKLQLCLVEQGV